MNFFKTLQKIILMEEKRQKFSVNLIASENLISNDILSIQSCVFTNKYAEGYPEKRYYAGCKYVNKIENLAIDFCKKLFEVKYVNVQPHSGTQANQVVCMALCKPNDVILGLDLSHGGHLSHGFSNNYSGYYHKSFFYYLNKDSFHIDYDELYNIANKCKPKLIIAGGSSYSRLINWRTISEIAKSLNSYFLADIAHISGLIASKFYPSPVKYADVVTSTLQKTLKGTRGGFILTNNFDIIKKINKSLFPGIQGGPFINIIAAKALSFYNASKSNFKRYQRNVLKNAKLFSNVLKHNNLSIISNGTDTHLFLVDLNNLNITGVSAEIMLEKFSIVVNKNIIPFEKKKSNISSGIRIGTPYITARGFLENEIVALSNILVKILKKKFISNKVKYFLFNLCRNYMVDFNEKNL